MVKDAHCVFMDANAHRDFCTSRYVYDNGIVDENESHNSFVVTDSNYTFLNEILYFCVVTHTDGNNHVDTLATFKNSLPRCLNPNYLNTNE